MTSDWVVMALLNMVEELRRLLDSGMPFVMIISIVLMLTWCADNLD